MLILEASAAELQDTRSNVSKSLYYGTECRYSVWHLDMLQPFIKALAFAGVQRPNEKGS